MLMKSRKEGGNITLSAGLRLPDTALHMEKRRERG